MEGILFRKIPTKVETRECVFVVVFVFVCVRESETHTMRDFSAAQVRLQRNSLF